MGLAVSTGKMGLAYLVDGELMDWKLSIGATRDAAAAFDQSSRWLGYYQVDVVVVEDLELSRHGTHTHLLLSAIVEAARSLHVHVEFVPNKPEATNKYAQAANLSLEFPQIAAWLPDKRRIWEREPRNIILFEALALAWRWWRSELREEIETIDW